MATSFTLNSSFTISPSQLYNAWLNSKKHSAFTGGKASISAKKGSKYTAWDGYISGKIIELEKYKRILHTWRTTEFPDEAPDSILEIIFTPTPKGTKLTLKHKNIPKGQTNSYKKGWKDYYFTPMKAYFEAQH